MPKPRRNQDSDDNRQPRGKKDRGNRTGRAAREDLLKALDDEVNAEIDVDTDSEGIEIAKIKIEIPIDLLERSREVPKGLVDWLWELYTDAEFEDEEGEEEEEEEDE